LQSENVNNCLIDIAVKDLLINQSTYNTDNNTPRSIYDRLLLSSRWYFFIKYVSVVFKSRKIALHGAYDTANWVSTSLDIFETIEACGGRFHITGLENIRNCQGPVVFVSNHMSTLETMIFPGIIAPIKEVTFVVKDSLVKHPLFGPIMRARNPIVVSRSDSREDLTIVMKQGLELLSKGMSVIIFPQSHRRVEFIPKEFNSLGVKLAKSANVQVIPVAIKTDFWGNGKFIKELGSINRKKPIYINFGKPLTIQGNGKEEHNKIIDFIVSNLELWNQ
jgi:1-acyl-sn-glycerol-3-phosphate acyltransferase